MRNNWHRLKSNLGTTLLELMVAMALVGIVLTSVAALIRVGTDYYFGSIQSLDLQKQALFGIARLSGDLTPTNISTVRRFDLPRGTDPPGEVNSALVFASPADLAGVQNVDRDGRVKWQSFLCYLVQDINGTPTLLRRVSDVPVPGGFSLTAPDPLPLGRDLAHFQGLTGGDIVSRGIIRMVTTVNSDTVEVKVVAQVQGRYEFELEVESTVLPRN